MNEYDEMRAHALALKKYCDDRPGCDDDERVMQALTKKEAGQDKLLEAVKAELKGV